MLSVWVRCFTNAGCVEQLSVVTGAASVIFSLKWKKCSDLSERSRCSRSIVVGGVLLNVRWSFLFTPLVCHRLGVNNQQLSLLAFTKKAEALNASIRPHVSGDVGAQEMRTCPNALMQYRGGGGDVHGVLLQTCVHLTTHSKAPYDHTEAP